MPDRHARDHGTVARQSETKRFGQAVHRLRREHAGTQATGQAGAAFVCQCVFVTDIGGGGAIELF